MAGLVSTLLLLIMQYVVLDCTKRTIKWVYKPYGIHMCRGLCEDSPDTFYYIQEDLSCQRVSANYSARSNKISPQHCIKDDRNANLESGCAFQRELDVCNRTDRGSSEIDIVDEQHTATTDKKQHQSRDEVADRETTDGQLAIATGRTPQLSTDADRNPCNIQDEVTTTRTGHVAVVQYKCGVKLQQACKKGKLDVVKSILSFENRHINCHGWLGKTPVMTAASYGRVAVFDYLVSQCCDLTAVDEYNTNVLHEACKGGNIDIVRKVMDSKTCDIESKDVSGKRPIMLSALRGHREVFQLLEGKGCNLTAVDNSKNNLLHMACISGSVDLLKYILSLNIFSIDVKGYEGRTPVMQAAGFGRKEVIQFLIECGCNLKMVDQSENNILHVACTTYGNVDVVNYLMTHGDCEGLENAKNINGHTPAQVAEQKGYKGLIQLHKGKK